MVAEARPEVTTHKIDATGAVYCACGKRLGFKAIFLTPEKSAAVVIARQCKYCGGYNLVALDRLEKIGG